MRKEERLVSAPQKREGGDVPSLRGAFEAAGHGLPQGVEVVLARVVTQCGEPERRGGRGTEKEGRVSAIGVEKGGREGGREGKEKEEEKDEEEAWGLPVRQGSEASRLEDMEAGEGSVFEGLQESGARVKGRGEASETIEEVGETLRGRRAGGVGQVCET